MFREAIVVILAASAWPSPLDEWATAGRRARDRADAATLRRQIEQARPDSGFDGSIRSAQLNWWLCEAASQSKDSRSVKAAASAGMDAADRAVKLRPDSSEAHRLLAAHLGLLIPHVFLGGIRYGARATREIETALQLDRRNAEAHIQRAIAYFFTPSLFGGSYEEAIQHLKSALEFDPASDTAHLWLAQVYARMNRKDRALAEIREALKLNPDRSFSRTIEARISIMK